MQFKKLNEQAMENSQPTWPKNDASSISTVYWFLVHFAANKTVILLLKLLKK